MKREVSVDLIVHYRGVEYSVKAVPHVLVGECLEICLHNGKVCAAYSCDDDNPETVYLPLPEAHKHKQETWVEFNGETCCYLREDSRLSMEVANGALCGLHAMLLDLKTSATKSWSTEDLADIVGCISEKLAQAVNETEEINRVFL